MKEVFILNHVLKIAGTSLERGKQKLEIDCSPDLTKISDKKVVYGKSARAVYRAADSNDPCLTDFLLKVDKTALPLDKIQMAPGKIKVTLRKEFCHNQVLATVAQTLQNCFKDKKFNVATP